MAGSIETNTISASNLKLKLKLTEAELGNKVFEGPRTGFVFLESIGIFFLLKMQIYSHFRLFSPVGQLPPTPRFEGF